MVITRYPMYIRLIHSSDNIVWLKGLECAFPIAPPIRKPDPQIISLSSSLTLLAIVRFRQQNAIVKDENTLTFTHVI